MSTDQIAPGTDPGTIIVCSGRCGSTLVSDLLAEHSAMVPLLEFFGSQYQAGMVQEVLSGEQFWQLVTEPWLSMNTVVRLGRVPKEVRYDLSRHETPPELSGLLGFTLPAISEDPDKLMEELAGLVTQFPTQQLGAHYRRLFTLLAQYVGKPRWVEKSAASGLYVSELLEMFPGVRIVYLTRDIVDVALSMTNHSMFLMADLSVSFQQRCGFDPFVKGSRPPGAQVPPDLEHLLPENLTPSVLDYRAGSEASMMNLIALQAMMARQTDDALRDLPDDRVIRIAYEELLQDPEGELARLGSFLAIDDSQDWAKRSADRVAKPRPRSDKVDEAGRARYQSFYNNIYQSAPMLG
ncbi:sulfotransferase family protein [Streptomyces sp. NPDC057136]|uniref:sulfotransferase family protein n=1 Tax=Streptomyces sp. NPDC057136 TaxID=3346029 RepID=UPI00362CBA2B